MDWVLLITGLIVLLAGGDLLVRGAMAMSHRLGVSPRIIGLTIVALGTSMPELAVNLVAALRGDTAIVFGNLIGSNISNLGLLVGLSLLLSPIKIEQSVIRRDIPIMLGVSLLAVALSQDHLWSQNADAINGYDGVLLLLVFIVIFAWTLRSGRAWRLKLLLVEINEGHPGDTGAPSVGDDQRRDDSQVDRQATGPDKAHRSSWFRPLIMLFAGLAGVICGSDLTIEGASRAAETLGLSQTVVGLTILAIGTSLPALATCLIAAAKGNADLALGNAIGSNIINLTLILGISSVTQTITLPAYGRIDLWVMLAAALALWAAAGFGRKKLNWIGGILFLGGYITYIVLRIVLSTSI